MKGGSQLTTFNMATSAAVVNHLTTYNRVDFKTFTDDLLAQNITAQDIADHLGVSRNTILRARMEGRNARPAPPEWEPRLRELAKARSANLARLAKGKRVSQG